MPDPIIARVEPPSPNEQTMREARRIAESVTDSDWKALDPQEMIDRIAEALATKQAEIERWKREAMAWRTWKHATVHDVGCSRGEQCQACEVERELEAARVANGATP